MFRGYWVQVRKYNKYLIKFVYTTAKGAKHSFEGNQKKKLYKSIWLTLLYEMRLTGGLDKEARTRFSFKYVLQMNRGIKGIFCTSKYNSTALNMPM